MKAYAVKLAAVLLIGIVAGLCYPPAYNSHSTVTVHGNESFALAYSLLNHRTFADPFAPLPTGPSRILRRYIPRIWRG
jgi:hypothetical protein